MGLPWQSVVWLACIQCRVCGFNLWSGNWDPTCYAVWPKQTNRNSWMSGYRQTEVRYRGFSHKERVVDACALHCFVYIFILTHKLQAFTYAIKFYMNVPRKSTLEQKSVNNILIVPWWVWGRGLGSKTESGIKTEEITYTKNEGNGQCV